MMADRDAVRERDARVRWDAGTCVERNPDYGKGVRTAGSVAVQLARVPGNPRSSRAGRQVRACVSTSHWPVRRAQTLLWRACPRVAQPWHVAQARRCWYCCWRLKLKVSVWQGGAWPPPAFFESSESFSEGEGACESKPMYYYGAELLPESSVESSR
jgi:hypothetical protein